MKLIKIGKIFMLTGAITLMAVSMMKINAAAAEAVDINEKNFPDPQFRKYVLNECDKDKNKILDSNEMKAVTKILLDYPAEDEGNDKNYSDVQDLTGLEYFTDLRELNVSPYKMNELNLSANQQLEHFVAHSSRYSKKNVLNRLDISQNSKLKSVVCEGTDLQEIKLPVSNQIEGLGLNENNLENLDVTLCPNLMYLSCDGNNLKTIDLSNCKKLDTLICKDNNITSLKVNQNTKLNYLDCGLNPIKTIDVSACKQLKQLHINRAKLTSLNVSSNKKLEVLYVERNQLKKLDLSKNAKLKQVFCKGNKIKKLNLYKNGKLIYAGTDKGVKRIPPKAVFKNEKVKIKTLKKSGKNKIKVNLEKVNDAAGYQVCYSTNKNFSNAKKVNSNKKSITLKGIKENTTYYIKVRAYAKNPEGKKIYSKNSKPKKI